MFSPLYAFTLLDFLIFVIAWVAVVGWALAFYHRLTAPPVRDPRLDWAEWEAVRARRLGNSK